MVTIGLVFCAVGLLHGVFKYFVIRSVARDVYNGGGVPVLDFVILVPLWLSFGGTFLLEAYALYPFPFFGFVAYFVLALILYGMMQLEYRLGRPELERRLREMELQSGKETRV